MDSPTRRSSMAIVKISRSGSSLIRSPTIKSNVDSLTCFSSVKISVDTACSREKLNESMSMDPEAMTPSRKNHDILHRTFQLQLLIPPLTLVTICILWWYAKASPNDHNTSSRTFLPSVWFDFLAATLFFASLIQCARIILSQVSVRSTTSGLVVLGERLLYSLGCKSFALLPKQIIAATTEHYTDAGLIRSSASSVVTWTFGSKSKCERSSNICGERVVRYAEGERYEGEIDQGSCSGSGVYYFCSSGKYEGDWVDGKYNGYGVETCRTAGSRYKGQFCRGFRNGYGVYRFQTGDEYSGEWLNGQSHGYGVQTCGDGSRYIGEFKRGMKHGLGYYRFRNGDTYTGEYFEDKMHGYGVYRFGMGHAYEGSWHEGSRQGLGVYAFKNGEANGGEWNSDALIISNDLSPGSPPQSTQTNLWHAVQEARRAALKALKIPHVGDQVKKAVAAADKAAKAARNAAIRAIDRDSQSYLLIPYV